MALSDDDREEIEAMIRNAFIERERGPRGGPLTWLFSLLIFGGLMSLALIILVRAFGYPEGLLAWGDFVLIATGMTLFMFFWIALPMFGIAKVIIKRTRGSKSAIR